jgi:hypothetical protein
MIFEVMIEGRQLVSMRKMFEIHSLNIFLAEKKVEGQKKC